MRDVARGMNVRLHPENTDASAAAAAIPGRGDPSVAERLVDPSLPIEERLERVTSCVVCGSSELEDVDPAAWVRTCSRCGHAFRSPRPTHEAVRAFQSRATRYDPWIRDLGARRRCWVRRIRTLRRFVRSGRLLDVGAGIGEFLHHASPYFDVEGVEISDEAIARAHALFSLRLRHGTVEEIAEAAAGTFDAVSLIHVLEHVHDPRRELDRCRRLLRPHGWLYVCVPNDSPVGRFRRELGTVRTWARMLRRGVESCTRPLPFGSVDPARGSLDREIHLSHFSLPSLRALITRSGFRIVGVGADGSRPGSRWRRIPELADEVAWRLVGAALGVVGHQDLYVVAQRAEPPPHEVVPRGSP